MSVRIYFVFVCVRVCSCVLQSRVLSSALRWFLLVSFHVSFYFIFHFLVGVSSLPHSCLLESTHQTTTQNTPTHTHKSTRSQVRRPDRADAHSVHGDEQGQGRFHARRGRLSARRNAQGTLRCRAETVCATLARRDMQTLDHIHSNCIVRPFSRERVGLWCRNLSAFHCKYASFHPCLSRHCPSWVLHP